MARLAYPLRLDCDGETFVVRRRGPGSYGYDWVSGPNPGYGFSRQVGVSHDPSGPPPGTTTSAPDLTVLDHEESIRGFLAGIDPRTGHLEDQ